MAQAPDSQRKTVCVNRKARHDYDVLDTFEAGLSLRGSEVKALREGKGNLADAYVLVRNAVATVRHMDISRYTFDNSETAEDAESRRPRRLLLHKAEIRKLEGRVREKGLTLIPLSVYFRGPWAKLEIGLCRGRQKADKREVLRRKAAQRDIDRAYRGRR